MGHLHRHILYQAWARLQQHLRMQISYLSPLKWQQIKANFISISALEFLLKRLPEVFSVFLPVDPLSHLVFQRQLAEIFLGIYQCCHRSGNSLSQTILQPWHTDKNGLGTPCAKPDSKYTKLLTCQLSFASLEHVTGFMCQNVTLTQKEERTSACHYMPWGATVCILSPSIRDIPSLKAIYSQEATEFPPG